jgi:hypothetical protein
MRVLQVGTLLFVAMFGTNCAHAAMVVIETPILVWFIVGVAAGILFHEAGHALCAICTGHRVRRVVIGSGPLVLRVHFKGAKLELRILPLGGRVIFQPPGQVHKLATALVSVGGILGNLALVGIIAALASVGAVMTEARAPLTTIVVAQFFLVAVNLLPYRFKVGYLVFESDGLKLLTLLWPRLERLQSARIYASLVDRYSDQKQVRKPSAASLRIVHQIKRIDGWWDSSTRRDIQRALVSEVAGGELPREEEMLVLDTLLTLGLVCGDPEFRPYLDEWSLRALALGPEIPTLVATRGGVLIELGHFEAGRSLLSPLLSAKHAGSADAIFDALLARYFLSRAEHALGDVAAARAHASEVRKTAAVIEDVPAVSVLMQRFKAIA